MKQATSDTVSVTANFSIPLRRDILRVAKQRKMTVTELIRPWLMEAADVNAPSAGEDLPEGTPRMPITIRIPTKVREAFGRIAEEHGTTVSGVAAAVIVDRMRRRSEAAA